MDLGSIFLILALALLVAIFVSRPFTDRTPGKSRLVTVRSGSMENLDLTPDLEKHHSSLLAERERLLGALQELEFDFEMGKIPAEEYPEQRKHLLQSGAAVLKELDEIENTATSEPAEARMEAEAARISLTGQQPTAKPEEKDDLESLIAERRRKRSEKSAGFCPKCGKPVQSSDEFCPKCGKKL